jgi:NAD+ kinase
VCLGGDGVILHASHLFRSSIPPVVAFNLGSLGFMTNSTFNECAQVRCPQSKVHAQEPVWHGLMLTTQLLVQELSGVIYGSQQLDSCSLEYDSMEETGNTLGGCLAHAGSQPYTCATRVWHDC